jgi:hypothetical protein
LPRPDNDGTKMKFPHRKAKATVTADDDQATWIGPPRLADHSCCCPARPVVRVLMPVTSERPHPFDLLLCGHHYLASRAALAAASAVAIDETGAVLEPAPTSTRAEDRTRADTASRR